MICDDGAWVLLASFELFGVLRFISAFWVLGNGCMPGYCWDYPPDYKRRATVERATCEHPGMYKHKHNAQQAQVLHFIFILDASPQKF